MNKIAAPCYHNFAAAGKFFWPIEKKLNEYNG